MSFASPGFLVGLVAVPLLAVAYALHERRRRRALSRYASPALLPSVIERSPGFRRHLPIALVFAALAAMIVGVARPTATLRVPRQEATVIVAIDTSLSMSATDVKPSRLDRAKALTLQFISKIPSSYRVALITFGSRAAVAVPPADDRTLIGSALRLLRPGTGTALGDALVLSANMARRERTSDGAVPPAAVLLVTDGAPDGGQTPVPIAIQKVSSAHIPVYSMIVGTSNGTVQQTLTGGYQEQVRVAAQPQTLRLIAKGTGGDVYTGLSDPRLKQVYERLGSKLGSHRTTREVTDFFAGGSALLLLCGSALSLLWFRRVL
ncbi:MAG: VWA domain-containing protein [Gaiellaceae bacterium]